MTSPAACYACYDRAHCFLLEYGESYVVRDPTNTLDLTARVSTLVEAVRLWRAVSQSKGRFVPVLAAEFRYYDSELEAFVAGNVPVSWTKVAAVVGAGLALAAVLVLLGALL